MIRTSLRRFYSTAPKPPAKDAKSFPLARPVKPRPAATRPTPPKERTPIKQPTKLEDAFLHVKSLRKRSFLEATRMTLGNGFRKFPRWIVTIFGVFVFGHLFQTHIYEYGGTVGASMLPTFYFEGDWVLVNKFYRRGKGIQVGDVVSAKDPFRSEGLVIKRVIGMPGDFVLADSVETTGRMIQIPQGHCFLAGDNQPHSRDSRIYGPIPLALIRGKVVLRVRPFEAMERVENNFKPVDEKEIFGGI